MQAEATFSATSSRVTLIRLLSETQALEKDSVGGDSNESWFSLAKRGAGEAPLGSGRLHRWSGRPDIAYSPGPLAQPGGALEGASGQPCAAARLLLSLTGNGAGCASIGGPFPPQPWGRKNRSASPPPGRRPKPPSPLLSS